MSLLVYGLGRRGWWSAIGLPKPWAPNGPGPRRPRGLGVRPWAAEGVYIPGGPGWNPRCDAIGCGGSPSAFAEEREARSPLFTVWLPRPRQPSGSGLLWSWGAGGTTRVWAPWAGVSGSFPSAFLGWRHLFGRWGQGVCVDNIFIP